MQLRQLQMYKQVVDDKSISKAAESLYVAQPAITRQIKLLEKELHTKLLIRTNKGIIPTESGEILYNQSKNIFNSIFDIKNRINDTANNNSLNIGTITSNSYLAAEGIKSFKKTYKNAKLTMQTTTPDFLIKNLENDDLDIIFLRKLVYNNSNFETKKISETTIELILSKSIDPTPDKNFISIKELKTLPICLYKKNDLWGYNDILFDELNKQNIIPNIFCECVDTKSILRLVKLGCAASFLPTTIIHGEKDKDLISKPIKNYTYTIPTILVWKKNSIKINTIKNFVNYYDNIKKTKK